MFELVPFEGTDGQTRQVPRCFKEISGEKTREKLQLCNKMVVDWQLRMKHKKQIEKGECPWLQPSSQNTRIRIFFAFMKKEYSWPFTQNDLSGFNGCLKEILQQLYEGRKRKWVSMYKNRILYEVSTLWDLILIYSFSFQGGKGYACPNEEDEYKFYDNLVLFSTEFSNE